MASTPRILLVDSDPTSRTLLCMLIGARWPTAVVTEVSEALGLARAMRGPSQDLCVVDPDQDWADSRELLQLLTEDARQGPVVVYSPEDRAQPAIAAIQAGAASYVIKDSSGPLKLVEELSRWLGPGLPANQADPVNDGEFRQALAMISHDLQEPMRSVQNYLEVLNMEHGETLSEPVSALLAQASKAANQAVQSLRQTVVDLQPAPAMPTFPEAELPMLELDEDDESVESTTAWNKDVVRFPEVVTNATLVLDETLEILAATIEKEGAEIHRETLAPVAVQSGHLRRILQNLVSNALKFRTDTPPRIHISSIEQADTVCFRVQDNGIGIDPVDHTRIFQMFSRVHDGETFPGTGIGLAAAKNLVESYGGHIEVESTPGQGSCFVFTLPAVPGARVRASRKT